MATNDATIQMVGMNTKVYNKFDTTQPALNCHFIPLGDENASKCVFIKPTLRDDGVHLAMDYYERRVVSKLGEKDTFKWGSLGYEKKLAEGPGANVKEDAGSWLTVTEWKGMKAVMEQYRDPESRHFLDEELPITTANFDSKSAPGAVNHCFIIASVEEEIRWIISGNKWTIGGIYYLYLSYISKTFIFR